MITEIQSLLTRWDERQAEAERLRAEHARLAEQEETARVERELVAEEGRLARVALEAETKRLADERAESDRVERERRAALAVEAQRLADERAAFEAEQLAAKVPEVKAVEAPESNVLQFTAPLPVSDKLPGVSVTIGGESIASTIEETDPSAETLTASMDLKVYLIMESVCKAAQAWAVFQAHDSKLDQKKDRKLAAAAKTAELNLLAMVEQLP